MNDNARGFCVSCGVARNFGDTCDYCGRHYVESTRSPEQTKRHTALSTKYKITKNQHNNVITWRWSNNSAWIMIAFSIIWIAMTVPVAIEVIGEPLHTIPIPLLFPFVGLALMIHGIMRMVNKTSIYAGRQSLYLKHHPIPWRGKYRIAANEIEQVFVSRIQRSKKNRTWQTPALQLITKAGQRHELLKGSSESDFIDFESLRLIILKGLDIKPEPSYDSFSQVARAQRVI